MTPQLPTQSAPLPMIPQLVSPICCDSTEGNAEASVVIVVPCYNEETRLDGARFVRALNRDSRLRFLFVDDGSEDETQILLRQIQSVCPDRIELLALPQNRGKAEAVRQGLMLATKRGAGLVGYWDADLATPLSAISDFLEIANRYNDVQVIFGSRVQLQGHRISRTLSRRTVSRICSTLARLAVRLPVRDTQCGAKMLRNTPDLRACLGQKFTAGWLFDVQLFSRLSVRMMDRRNAFYEFPLSEWSEIAGSKVTSLVVLKSGLGMLRLVVESRFSRGPSNAPDLSTTSKKPRLAA